MALLYLDSMSYATEDLHFRYVGVGTAIDDERGFFRIDTVPNRWPYTTRRNGTNCLTLDTYNRVIAYNFPVEDYSEVVTLGYAFRVNYMGNNYYPIIAFYNDNHILASVFLQMDGSFRVKGGVYGSQYFSSDPKVYTALVWQYLEVQVKIHATEGYIIIRRNETVVLEVYNINTFPGGEYAKVSQIRFGGTGGGPNDLAFQMNIQDLYILNDEGAKNTTFLGDTKVEILRPDAPGTYTQFRPFPNENPTIDENWKNVDDGGHRGDEEPLPDPNPEEYDIGDPIPCDEDATYNQSNVVGNIETYNMSEVEELAVAEMQQITITNPTVGDVFELTCDTLVLTSLAVTDITDLVTPFTSATDYDLMPFTISAGINSSIILEWKVKGPNSIVATLVKTTGTGASEYLILQTGMAEPEIFGSQQCTIMKKTDAEIRYAKQVFLSGTAEEHGVQINLNDTYTFYLRCFDVDPDDGLDWDRTRLNEIQSGITVTL